MELFFRIRLFAAGVINFLPSMLAFMPSKITKSYQVEVIDNNYELLLRHRAMMFGLVGGLLIFASLSQKYYEVALFVGLFSMLGFVLLYCLIGKEKINIALRKVMWIDVFTSIILILSALGHYFL